MAARAVDCSQFWVVYNPGPSKPRGYLYNNNGDYCNDLDIAIQYESWKAAAADCILPNDEPLLIINGQVQK